MGVGLADEVSGQHSLCLTHATAPSAPLWRDWAQRAVQECVDARRSDFDRHQVTGSVYQEQLLRLPQQVPQWLAASLPWVFVILTAIDHELRRANVGSEVEVGRLGQRGLNPFIDPGA